MKLFILIFSLVQHWNRRSIININEFYQLVLGQFPSFWLRYAGIVLWPSTYLFIYFRQVIVSLSIFCCKYFLVAVVRNRFYLLTTDRPTDRPTDGLMDWPTDWLTDWLIDWLTDWQMFDETQMMMIMTKNVRFKQPHIAIELWILITRDFSKFLSFKHKATSN